MPSPYLDKLRLMAEKRRSLGEKVPEIALKAKEDGATLQQIGDALGVTRQAAHSLLKGKR